MKILRNLFRKAVPDPENPWNSLYESTVDIVSYAFIGVAPITLLAAHAYAVWLVTDIPWLLLGAEAGIRIAFGAILILGPLILLLFPAGHLLKRRT